METKGVIGCKSRIKLVPTKGGDSVKAFFWKPNDQGLIDDIVLAWKRLAVYGVEAFEICCLIDRKSGPGSK